ncbi:MAG: ABC transporter permease [Desulfobacteraceae bacterium]|nr:ABC transporter permease [Desulfobacteraceae bacterium]
MPKSENHLKQGPDETLDIHLGGKWQLGRDNLSIRDVNLFLEQHPGTRRIIFNCKNLDAWDSSILTFLLSLIRIASRKNIQVEKDELPSGIQQLITLATAVPQKEDAKKSVPEPGFFETVGADTIRFVHSIGELMEFIGGAFLAVIKLFVRKPRFRSQDFWQFLMDAGARAVPIVSLISFLVGLILAFVGIMQLKLFGAQIFVADLVGIAMVRQMGAIMTGIIMAGRTGAAFASQLGTMQVNEEIDAFKTLAISPMEFLVLPRMLALTLMMPFLVLYADLMGVLGGALVAVGIFDISLPMYLTRTIEVVGLNDLFIGLFMGVVFGILISLSGCMRGIQCERSASAVGDAATSAVVTGIVAIIIATSVITILCDIIGI